jgi:hypothetical protein
MRYLFVYLTFFMMCGTAAATNWQQHRDDYSTRATTLPRGRTQFQLSVDSRSFDSRKAASGGQESLGTAFYQNLRSASGSYIREYDITVDQTKWTVGMIHGLTSDWTVGFRLPVVREQSIVRSQTYKMQKSGIKTAIDNVSAAQTEVMGGPGYQAADQIQIGHMEFIGKYLVSKKRDFSASLLQEVRFPTGESSPTDLVTNQTPGAEGYGLGVGMVVDVWTGANLRTGFKFNHAVNLNDEIQYRGQKEKDKKYSRDPGDESELGVLLEYNIISRYFVSAGLSYATRQADQLSDSVLEKNLELSRSERQVAEFGLGLLPPDSRHDFPAAAQLRYAVLIDGKSTEATNALSLQTSITF